MNSIRMNRRILLSAVLGILFTLSVLAWKTNRDLLPIPESLTLEDAAVRKVQVLDRYGGPLTVTYQNRWNIHDYLPLHRIPVFLQQIFVESEDRRFYRHHGVDWLARMNAVVQNLGSLRIVRGASTITEQVVRMWHPRPRTVWSRWLEGFEAVELEKRFTKKEVLEFYLNQVPYAAQRRGVAQAAAYYFGRDPDTLSTREMLALTVLVRAPGRLDPRRDSDAIEGVLIRLANHLQEKGILDRKQVNRIRTGKLVIQPPSSPIRATHFVQHVYRHRSPFTVELAKKIRTTLDGGLQRRIQNILDQRLDDLRARHLQNGAVLVVDHLEGEILAWVNGQVDQESHPLSWLDGVTSPRQPGSTLKPFLYALALEKGWTAATLLDDRPLSMPVGAGQHTYKNYSRVHYGPLRVREALANSLNIPAIRAIQFVGVGSFLNRLQRLGFASLQQHPQYYGEGLALGNGEVTLLELVRAYSVLAARGIFQPIRYRLLRQPPVTSQNRIMSPEISSLVADILSDPEARQREFGSGGLLQFPVQTAVKTGTSNDYRDAWAIGFNHRYTIGVWMGNLDGTETGGITGAIGPVLVLRSMFGELNRHKRTRPLYLSPKLVQREICRTTGLPADGTCPSLREWFVPGTAPRMTLVTAEHVRDIRFVQPTAGLHLAMDARIPDSVEAIDFQLSGLPEDAHIDWFLDGCHLATTTTNRFSWNLTRGVHTAHALVKNVKLPDVTINVPAVRFYVK